MLYRVSLTFCNLRCSDNFDNTTLRPSPSYCVVTNDNISFFFMAKECSILYLGNLYLCQAHFNFYFSELTKVQGEDVKNLGEAKEGLEGRKPGLYHAFLE